MDRIKKIWEGVVLFFNTTKLGHFIKTSFISFTGIFFGILFASPIINELFKTNFPTIQQLTDVWPVVIDAFYRSIWAFLMVQIGVYKYSSSSVEANKSNIIPSKQGTVLNGGK